MPSTPTTFSIAEAAKELGITERRVRQLIAENRLKTDTDGMGRQRLSRAQIDRELKRRGRVSVKSLPQQLDGGVPLTDPLVARLDEHLAALTEVVDQLQDIRALVMTNTRSLAEVFTVLERLDKRAS